MITLYIKDDALKTICTSDLTKGISNVEVFSNSIHSGGIIV